ncbi:hypothetical protein ACFW7J_21785 [Streptomyces sp. NPDC059525]|uniref:hypothetical protein n=1 Tax=Streptomyces sp. NPDC059525 TaxID=3346857 RepID=UPI0036CFF41B
MADMQEPTEIPSMTVLSAEDVKPEDIGILSLHYVEGVAQLVVSGGTVLPDHLQVVTPEGATVATFIPVPTEAARNLIVQDDGSNVRYTRSGEAIWHTNTASPTGSNDSVATIVNNGQFVMPKGLDFYEADPLR